jgi:hypothetical protein
MNREVWVMVPKDTGQVFVYDNEAAARADATDREEVRRVPVDHEAVSS